IYTEKSVPVWPFIKSVPVKNVPPPGSISDSRELEGLLSSVRGIESALKELLQRPSPAPADVLAAHVHAIRQRGGIPSGPDPADDPMFIPSQIIPTDLEANIQAYEGEVEKDDFNEGAEALRRVRGK
ncbi:hypothetical protein LCGC14_1949770, partial [marine sediment metagenome]